MSVSYRAHWTVVQYNLYFDEWVEIKDWLKYDPRGMPGLKNLTILTCSFLGRGIVVVVGSHFLVFFHTVIKQCFKALRPCSHSHCTYRLPTKQAGRGKKKKHFFFFSLHNQAYRLSQNYINQCVTHCTQAKLPYLNILHTNPNKQQIGQIF